MQKSPSQTGPHWLSASHMSRLRRWRELKDLLARYAMAIGGLGVIVAIAMIFFYLLYVVFPLFVPASSEALNSYALPAAGQGQTLYLAVEEQNQVALRVTAKGRAVFFNTNDGAVLENISLGILDQRQITAFAKADAASGIFAVGLSDGSVLLRRHRYDVSYPDDQRLITPKIEAPLGLDPILLDSKRNAIRQLALASNEDETTILALTEVGDLVLTHVSSEASMLDDEPTVSYQSSKLEPIDGVLQFVIEPQQAVAYIAQGSGELAVVDISNKQSPRLHERVTAIQDEQQISRIELLNGGISLLVASNDGSIAQWFPVRDEYNRTALKRIRTFQQQGMAISDISPEQRRKGFVAVDQGGNLGVFHSTAHRRLLLEPLSEHPLSYVALSPRADTVIAQDASDRIHFWAIHNEHPEVSWGVLWQKIWYENYQQPGYIWQSSSASNDFEPKFSLTPLAFGTFKAAFYAMLVAVPLAIFGAIFTAYFMAPRMRSVVKPTIEIMEALPTVILGFLAGLWLAPLIELHLPGVFAMLLLLPLGVLLTAALWQHIPKRLRLWLPEGWQPLLLLPVILLIAWLALAMSPSMEAAIFSGDMRQWLSANWGLDFDQRNAIVVGIAMGIAVVPTIFSMTEDAIFSVPKHLSYGSLALGATPWQTLVRVILLTASPGIFSAVMIGLGRAVGETMIVLMATGNTAIMDYEYISRHAHIVGQYRCGDAGIGVA